MGKTNQERALWLLSVIDIRNDRALTRHGRNDDPEINDTDVVERALDKAEKRGRKKERESISWVHGYDIGDNKTAVYIVNQQPPFDAEKVIDLITTLEDMAYSHGVGNITAQKASKKVKSAIYSALHIKDPTD